MKNKILLLIIFAFSCFGQEKEFTAQQANLAKEHYYDFIEKVGVQNLHLILGAQSNEVKLLSKRAAKSLKKSDFKVATQKWTKALLLIKEAKVKGKITRTKDGILQLDQVFLDPKKNEVYFWVKTPVLVEGSNPNDDDSMMDSMPLELLIANNHGRIHETLFVTEARPFHLHTLLVMLGLSSGTIDDEGNCTGDLVDIFTEYTTMEGEKKTCLIEDLLFDMKHKQNLPKNGWLFVGPEITDERYIPDFNGELLVDMMGISVLITTNKLLWESKLEINMNKKISMDKRVPVKIIIKARRK